MRTICWIIGSAFPDLAVVAAVVLFGTPGALLSLQAAEFLLMLPITVACLGWWICLFSGNQQLLPPKVAWMEWRIAAILIATLLSVAVTLVGLIFGLQAAAAGFMKDVFAAWCGSVAFFGLVGIVVSVVSLSNAAEDSFPARVRVLVRGRTGPHIDDFTERLRTSLAHYAESVSRELKITEYDAGSGMYRLRVDIETVIRSFVDDIDTVYVSQVSYRPDHRPPLGKFHKLVRLVGVECDNTPIESATTNPIVRDYRATGPAGEIL